MTFTEGARGAGRDVGLLRFMAEKTTNGSGLDEQAVRSMLWQRFSQIDDLASLLGSKKCFRAELVEYFEGPKVHVRQSLGMRVLNWVFSKEAAQQPFKYCCDSCAGLNQRDEALPDHVTSAFVCSASR